MYNTQINNVTIVVFMIDGVRCNIDKSINYETVKVAVRSSNTVTPCPEYRHSLGYIHVYVIQCASTQY